ncbi:hypothetical protein [Demequina silvatica]|uniref:hypothetical protein n=1 Tax=Demequina silvatica TaxID=1638988 RepID=UPI000785CE96|nr:hypothetical protein [Demequina silvatica]
MGIRYYAYAFPPELTAAARADPRAFIGRDPLADAWGTVPGAQFSVITGVPALPAEDMLYLDKAWPGLQSLTAPDQPGAPPRPAFRMFEGKVRFTDRGWDPWVRAVTPEEVPRIAEDVALLQRETPDGAADDYVLEYLEAAVAFTAHQASVGRGFAYLIG